jgi:DNA-binding MarR family transcriptional regulator
LSDSIQPCARAILDTAPAIVQAIRVEMRAERLHELSVPQFRTLAFVARHPGCSLSDAAEFIGMTLPSMSVLINGLVEDGLVLRQTSLLDRRRVTLTLTAAGSAIHTRSLEGTLAWLVRQLEPLAEADRQSVLHAMEVLRPLFVANSTATPATEAVHA